jgi:hypothetical protein
MVRGASLIVSFQLKDLRFLLRRGNLIAKFAVDV